MLKRVKSRKRWHTNSNAISSSSILSAAKLFYYRLFMYYYSLSLRSAVQNKKQVSNSRIVYPPCDTREMATIPLEGRERTIISVAQFRFEVFS
ncbi:hypothetical protein MPER_02085, partial [Moniliophthora perniciosa FA553]